MKTYFLFQGTLRAFIAGFIMLVTLSAYTQTDQEVYLFDKNTNPGAILTEIPQEKPKLEGSAYLYDEWKPADLVLKNNKVLNGVNFNYDMLNEIFELNRDKFAKNLHPAHFKSIRVYEDFNPSKFTLYEVLNNEKFNGPAILEILYRDQKLTLAKRPYVKIKNSTYVPTHHTGNINMQILRKNEYYLIEDDSLTSFKNNKSSLLEISGIESKQLKNYIKEKRLDLKDDDDLVKVIQYLFM